MKYLNENKTKRLMIELSMWLDENEPSRRTMAKLLYGLNDIKNISGLQSKTIKELTSWWMYGKIRETALAAIVARYTYKDDLVLSYGGISTRLKYKQPYPSNIDFVTNLNEMLEFNKRLKKMTTKMTWNGSINLKNNIEEGIQGGIHMECPEKINDSYIDNRDKSFAMRKMIA